jgi:hypothetical protein
MQIVLCHASPESVYCLFNHTKRFSTFGVHTEHSLSVGLMLRASGFELSFVFLSSVCALLDPHTELPHLETKEGMAVLSVKNGAHTPLVH